jgi:hypothetical protein
MPSGTGKRIWLRPEVLGSAVVIPVNRRGRRGRAAVSFILRDCWVWCEDREGIEGQK